MKILYLTIIIFSLIITSCNKDEQLSKLENDQELIGLLLYGLKKINSNKSDIQLNSVNEFFETNKYSDYASLVFLDFSSKTIHPKNESLEKPICFSNEITNLEKQVFSILFNSLINKTFYEKVLIINYFDGFIKDKLRCDYQNERLLYLSAGLKELIKNRLYEYEITTYDIRILKSAKNSSELIALRGHEFDRCLDQCMTDKINDMNFVDWVFAAANPPLTVIQMVGSCSWTCAWK
jgi:hypothetical protein